VWKIVLVITCIYWLYYLLLLVTANVATNRFQTM